MIPLAQPVGPAAASSSSSAAASAAAEQAEPPPQGSAIRTRRSLLNQCGNGMHVNSIGAIIATVLLTAPSLGSYRTVASKRSAFMAAMASMQRTRQLHRRLSD